MCEVTSQNFEKILPELETIFNDARFLAVDAEFSCITASKRLQNSLFDSGCDRYKKLKTTVEQMIPLQVGITAFKFDSGSNTYFGDAYTFYLLPTSFELFDTRFVCQASSLQFLAQHGFDFNKLFYDGIPFLNAEQETELLDYIRNDGFDFGHAQSFIFEDLLDEQGKDVAKWFFNAKDCDTFALSDSSSYKPNVIYMLHKTLRRRFSNRLWTYIDTDNCQKFTVKKVDSETYKKLVANCNVDKQLLDYMLGFTKVFRLLKSVQKPIIGHNLFLDLMIMIHNFEAQLPKSYNSFKTLINSLFPIIFDTKHLSFNLFYAMPESKRWERNTLEHLHSYFKDGYGRHLALNSPIIECNSTSQQKFHLAGWDSFCTGYIFIRMAHKYAAESFRNVRGKKFVPSELINAVSYFKNKVNLIRADVPYICLEGTDPVSQRPPPFIIESNTGQTVNIDHITSLLSTYGFIEVKPHSYRGRRVIVAVDNFGSAKRILRQFPSHSEYKIQQYNVLKHSPVVRSILWCSIICSGTALAFFGYSKWLKTR